MFALLGKWVSRLGPLVLVAWLVVLGVTWKIAPPWEKVAQGGDAVFLPEDVPSRLGKQLFWQGFPDEFADSSVVLVLARADGQSGLRDEDLNFIAQTLTPRLKQIAEELTPGRGEPVVARIRSPDQPGVGALLQSRDRQAALVLVELTTPYLDVRNWPVIEKIEAAIAELRQSGAVAPGLEIALTGSAVSGRDFLRAELDSAHAVEVWTIVIVVALLLLTYRAPLAAVIPLATVFVAVQIALNVLAWLGESGRWLISRDLRIFITVLAYGAGVDYCVFLIARYQEELDRGASVGQAAGRAIGGAGGAVSASAATVICGIAMMAFARFVKIRNAGLTIPFSLIIVLLAALSFAPALLRLGGRWVFWPQRLREEPRQAPSAGLAGFLRRRNWLPDVWTRIGPALVRHPGVIWLGAVALMTPFAVAAVLNYNRVYYDPLTGLPPTAPSVAGARLLERHFPPGALGPVTVLVKSEQVRFDSDDGINLVGELTERLEARKTEFGIADVRSVAKPLGTSAAARDIIAGLSPPRRLVEAAIRQRAVSHYVSHTGKWTGHVTRMDLVLAVPPFSLRGIEFMDTIEQSLPGELPERLRSDAEVGFSGSTATVRDLRAVAHADQQMIQTLVPVAVFVLLLLVFRRFLVSLYLILSVAFSYLVTLGATFLVFWLADRANFVGLDWKVPLFLFTILVAVGEDYNIFLLSRVEEERRTHGPVGGILMGLARTGRIISTCGFIMAGTFAALFAGSFPAMKQLGFALAVGVLLDTLVVRPILVPTILLFLETRMPGLTNRAAQAPSVPTPSPTPS